MAATGVAMAAGWGADIRQGWRALRGQPVVSLAAILSLALAIGANTAIFTVWNAVLRHRMAVAQPERLVAVFTQAPSIPGLGYIGVSHLDYLDYANEPRVFSGSYELRQTPVALGEPGHTQQIQAAVVSPSYFDVLGVNAAVGRVFHASDAPADGTGAVAVLSHSAFVRDFGGDPSVVGATITINRTAFTLVGVASPEFDGTETLSGVDVWAPVTMHHALLPGATDRYFAARNAQFFSMVGRLQPGITVEEAAAAVKATGERLAREYPGADKPLTATVLPLTETGVSPNERGLYQRALGVVLAVVGLVLLIASVNVASLLVARAWARRRELAVRQALGATRVRLTCQLLAESLWLGGLACAAGLGLAELACRALWAARPAALSDAPVVLTFTGPVLWFAMGVSLAATLGFGLAPARAAAKLNVMNGLRGVAGQGSGGRGRTRGLLLAGEAAFSIVALLLAGLFLTSLRHLQAAAPGFDAAHVASLRFDLASTGFDVRRPGATAALANFERQLLEKVEQLPGVRAATLASGTPMNASALSRGYQIEGRDAVSGVGMRVAGVESVSPGGFFATLGIPLLEGRDILPSDTAEAPPVMIVNQTFARHAWPGQDALGKRVVFHAEARPTTVVGVAKDSTYRAVGEAPADFAYVPLAQEPTTALGVTVRAAGSPAALPQEMRQAVLAVNPELTVTAAEPAEAAMAASLWAARMGARLLLLLAGLATVLAAIGIYGMAMIGVRQRRREMGIRLALGASPRQVFGLVLGGGLIPVAAGLAVGIGAAVPLARLAGSLLYGVAPADPAVIAAVCGLFAAVAALACALPARRAAATDPLTTLRSE